MASCRRFVTNFAVFPRQGFARVLFSDGRKRVGFTPSENRIGVADAAEVRTLYYFTGGMERIDADYFAVRGSFRFRLSPGHDYDLSGGE